MAGPSRLLSTDDAVELGSWRIPRPLFCLGAGLAATLLASLIPPARGIAHGISLVPHELGHAVAAIFLGHAALPCVIMTVWSDQVLPLALLVWAAIGYGAWRLRERKPALAALVALALLYPLLAFTRAKDIIISLAGHGGEIAFACVLLRVASRGLPLVKAGEHATEAMIACATLGWAVQLKNVVFAWSLIRDPAAREHYYTHTVSGVVVANDYVKVAQELYWRLESVAALMLLVAIAAPAAVIALSLLLPPPSEGR